jgi:hypothetical protein
MRVLAIDPGTTKSAYTLIDAATCRPLDVGKVPNDELLEKILEELVGDSPDFDPRIDYVAIEMVASYGMAVGREVFETCVWIGRFRQLVEVYGPELPVDLVYRRDVKLHHCGTSAAKDPNVTQALIDRFASGRPNRGKGTKAEPGWFYGFRDDIWQAYALAVLVADGVRP